MPKVNLAFEVAEILHAVEAARILCDAARYEPLSTEYDTRAAPAAAAAVLSLVLCRLRDVRRVLIGDLDPSALAAPHNEDSPDDEDSSLRVRAPPPRSRGRRGRG